MIGLYVHNKSILIRAISTAVDSLLRSMMLHQLEIDKVMQFSVIN